MKQRKRVKRRGKVTRLQASAGGRKRPPGPTREWLGYYRPIKKAVTLRLDADVLVRFQRQGRGYQTRINRALRRVMSEERKISGSEVDTRRERRSPWCDQSATHPSQKAAGHPLCGLPSEGWATRPG